MVKAYFDNIKRFLEPPVFARDADKTRAAFYLYVLVQVGLAGILLSWVLIVLSGGSTPRILLLLPGLFILLAVLLLTRRGYVYPAAAFFVGASWLLAVLSLLSSGGVRATGFSILVVIVVMAGLLLGMRGAVIVAVASLLAGLGMAWAAYQEYIPFDTPTVTPLSALATQILVLIGVLGIVYLAMHSIQESLKQAKAEVQERQQAEAALRQSLARHQALLEAIPDLIFEFDQYGNHLDFVPVAGFKLYVPPEQFVGRNIRDVMPPDVATPALQAIQRVFQTGEAQTLEYSLPAGEGHGEYEARIVLSRVNTVLCMVRDVTRPKQVERQNRQYADIVRNMQVGMYIIQAEDLRDDRSLRVIAANPAALRYSEKFADEVLGKYMDEVFKTLRAKGFPQRYLQVLESGQPAELEDVYYDEQGKITEAYAVKVFVLTADTVGVLFENVSERKIAEASLLHFRDELEMRVIERTAQLEAANKELEAFVYSVSHDLRAPLRGIDGYSRLLLDDYAFLLDNDGLGHLERIRQASKRMSEMIDALLTLSRITRTRLERRPVDLSCMAQDILAALAESEPQRQVSWRVTPGIQVDCDPDLMRIALENLLQNAWKYTARQAVANIEFGMCESDGRDAYYVSDNGIGFDMANASRLFGAFQRLHRPDEFPGFGIGLATVQRIIQCHGGQIWTRAAVGKGATFYFSL
jgi:PAS domain S-box-containing protein